MLSSAEPIWMYNDNTDRRGTWHILPEMPPIKTLPAETVREEFNIYSWHDRGCRREYTGGLHGDYVWTCTQECPVQRSDVGSITIGKYYLDVEYPETKESDWAYTSAPSAICNQVSFSRQGGRGYRGNWWGKKAEDGQVFTVKGKQKPLYLHVGEEPVGPVCSRCVSKWEKQHGSE